MQIRQIIIYCISIMLLFLISFIPIGNILADKLFKSSYPCHISSKICQEKGGVRKIDGFEVKRDCWKWKYIKKCDYPSKNNCRNYQNCYFLGQKGCILRDSLGNCVNLKKEFSCEYFSPTHIEAETVRYGLEDKEGSKSLICKGIPCIDGNCVDKSYDMDDSMVDSISQLSAISQAKNDKNAGFKIFEGGKHQCKKSPIGALSCCNVYPGGEEGWGESFGGKCSKDEKTLSQLRSKNRCVFATIHTEKTLGIGTSTHHYCCFSNILEKIVQEQARQQLGLSFSNGNTSNCRGLTLDEIKRVDFSKIDFTEVAADLLKQLKLPDTKDVKDRLHSAHKNNRRFNKQDPTNEDNRFAGMSRDIVKEVTEEKAEEDRIEQERIEQERVAEESRIAEERRIVAEKKKEQERIEQVRIAEAKRLAAEKRKAEEFIAKARLEQKNRASVEHQEQRNFQTRMASLRSIESCVKSSHFRALRQEILNDITVLYKKLDTEKYRILLDHSRFKKIRTSLYGAQRIFENYHNLCNTERIQGIQYVISDMPKVETLRKKYQSKLNEYNDARLEYYITKDDNVKSRLSNKINILETQCESLKNNYKAARNGIYATSNHFNTGVNGGMYFELSVRGDNGVTRLTGEAKKILPELIQEMQVIKSKLARELHGPEREQCGNPWSKIANDHQS